MKKKVIIVSISILLVLGIILSINSAPKDKININKNKIENNNKSIAIYLENSSGKYDKTTTFPIKNSGYTLNTSKSVCNGSTSLSWNDEEWGLELDNIDRENTKCYLYFDLKKVTIPDIIASTNYKTTTPDFSVTATTDEGVYAVSDGMYGGTSYYWRGAVTNNYVRFAGFCWRIIRINGDKTMRLIYDGSTCHSNGTSTAESIAVANVAYNTNYNQSNYVGWTYEGTNQRTLSGTASNAKTQLESWYSGAIIGTNASRVAQGKYCNDRDVASGYSWTIDLSSSFYYAARTRLYTDYAPTLSCNSGDVYILNVGLITADEVMYAGGGREDNLSYYLYNGRIYWTMSPNQCGNNVVTMHMVTNSGILGGIYLDVTYYGLRPVINLKADTLFKVGGTGTQSNPYEVS